MKVQLTWNAPCAVANGPSTVPSFETDRSGSAAFECASSEMTFCRIDAGGGS